MTLSRPYLVRAIYEWLLDNSLTPYLLVDVEIKDVFVPFEHVQDGKIILNISPTAIEALDLANDSISFSARFSGKSIDIYIPIRAVLALYSMENGKGMMFPEEEDIDTGKDSSQPIVAVDSKAAKPAEIKKKKKKPSFLKVVK